MRSPTPITKEPELAPNAEPVKVTSEETAAQLRQLMIEVVNNGTGTAASVPGVQVAGKTGTAELGPAALEEGETLEEGEDPEQELDAWFTGFAPASNPKLVAAALVVQAEGDGGTIAAPIVQQVLAGRAVGMRRALATVVCALTLPAAAHAGVGEFGLEYEQTTALATSAPEQVVVDSPLPCGAGFPGTSLLGGGSAFENGEFGDVQTSSSAPVKSTGEPPVDSWQAVGDVLGGTGGTFSQTQVCGTIPQVVYSHRRDRVHKHFYVVMPIGCPGRSRIVGGGAYVSAPLGDSRVVDGYPARMYGKGVPNTWRTIIENTSDEGFKATGYAICSRTPGFIYRAKRFKAAAGERVTASAACPDGTYAVSGGVSFSTRPEKQALVASTFAGTPGAYDAWVGTVDNLSTERVPGEVHAIAIPEPTWPLEADALVEARRRVHVEHPHRDLAVVAKTVLDAGRHQHERSGAGDRLLAGVHEGHLALEDVERVVLGIVDVRLEHAPGLDLDDRQVEARRVGGTGEKLDVADPVPLSGRDDDRTRLVAHSGNPIAAATTTRAPPMTAIRPPTVAVAWASAAPAIDAAAPIPSRVHHPPPGRLR